MARRPDRSEGGSGQGGARRSPRRQRAKQVADLARPRGVRPPAEAQRGSHRLRHGGQNRRDGDDGRVPEDGAEERRGKGHRPECPARREGHSAPCPCVGHQLEGVLAGAGPRYGEGRGPRGVRAGQGRQEERSPNRPRCIGRRRTTTYRPGRRRRLRGRRQLAHHHRGLRPRGGEAPCRVGASGLRRPALQPEDQLRMRRRGRRLTGRRLPDVVRLLDAGRAAPC